MAVGETKRYAGHGPRVLFQPQATHNAGNGINPEPLAPGGGTDAPARSPRRVRRDGCALPRPRNDPGEADAPRAGQERGEQNAWRRGGGHGSREKQKQQKQRDQRTHRRRRNSAGRTGLHTPSASLPARQGKHRPKTAQRRRVPPHNRLPPARNATGASGAAAATSRGGGEGGKADALLSCFRGIAWLRLAFGGWVGTTHRTGSRRLPDNNSSVPGDAGRRPTPPGKRQRKKNNAPHTALVSLGTRRAGSRV